MHSRQMMQPPAVQQFPRPQVVVEHPQEMIVNPPQQRVEPLSPEKIEVPSEVKLNSGVVEPKGSDINQ